MPDITATINANVTDGPQQVSVALPSAQAAQKNARVAPGLACNSQSAAASGYQLPNHWSAFINSIGII